jgi:hypothetical protein
MGGIKSTGDYHRVWSADVTLFVAFIVPTNSVPILLLVPEVAWTAVDTHS